MSAVSRSRADPRRRNPREGSRTPERTRMRWLLLALGVVLSVPAAAQDWPSRTIRVIVPYPAGGPADIMGRLAAQKLQEKLGVAVIVENRTGASGTIGAEFVRHAAPDGYTLVAAPSLFVLARLVVKAAPYDPV